MTNRTTPAPEGATPAESTQADRLHAALRSGRVVRDCPNCLGQMVEFDGELVCRANPADPMHRLPAADEKGVRSVDTPGEDATAAVTKRDQFLWEAPALRPVTSAAYDAWEDMPVGCPSWCDPDDGNTHAASNALTRPRLHASQALLVKLMQGGLYAYEDEDENGEDVVTAAHLEVWLSAHARNPSNPYIGIRKHYGDGAGEHASRYQFDVYLDEARELVAVLQHLIKIGQDS